MVTRTAETRMPSSVDQVRLDKVNKEQEKNSTPQILLLLLCNYLLLLNLQEQSVFAIIVCCFFYISLVTKNAPVLMHDSRNKDL